MSGRLVLETLKVSDVPVEYQDTITAAGVNVQIITQLTGFGRRRYFICPTCERKCGKLHNISYIKNRLYCQSCVPIDLYRVRRSLYDEAGQSLIVWHMNKMVATISDQPIKFPFHYLNYDIDPPPNMSRKKYREALLKLQILENMRFAVIAHGFQYTASDIRKYAGKVFISLFELLQVADFQIFGTRLHPEYYSSLLDESTAPKHPPRYICPLYLKIW